MATVFSHLSHIVNLCPTFYSTLQLTYSSDSETLSGQLRALMVREIKANSDDYRGFVIENNIEEEADKFLENGYFSGEIGNCIPLAVSNALGMPIFIIPTMLSQPVIALNPRKAHVFFRILVAFNHHGCGHYDAIDISNLPFLRENHQSDIQGKGCTCGRGEKGTSSHCIVKCAKYTTIVRCPCLKAKIPCTMTCACKNCSNENGRKETHNIKGQGRQRHKWQINIEKSMELALTRGEQVTPGVRTMFEFFILEEILNYCNTHSIEQNTQTVLMIYNAAHEISKGLLGIHSLRAKVEDDIDTFLKEHAHIVQSFQCIVVSQLATLYT